MKYYSYISTRAAYDPVKTIIVFAPDEAAATYEGVSQFAEESGWQSLAEKDAAVLLVPVAEGGWKNQSTSVFCNLYNEIRNACRSQNGNSLIGRRGTLWLWETMIHIAGYKEGAEFAHRCTLQYPNHFASAALIDGLCDDYSLLDLPSDHWLVKNVSDDYKVLNREIPVNLWLIGTEEKKAAEAISRYTEINSFPINDKEDITVNGIQAESYFNPSNPAERILFTKQTYAYDTVLADAILSGLFDHVIRWKNSPDGTLALIPGHRDFYQDGVFETSSVEVNHIVYPFSVHIPGGLSKEETRNLPLVFTVHGRGEPAWLFAVKNGWRELCDETGAFIVAAPDSPGNIWFFDRDHEVFEAMIRKIHELYAIDRERVYLTGFSNGGQITREVGTAHPELFAAIAPFNGPAHIPGFTKEEAVDSAILEKGYELPYFVSIGDNDAATGLDIDDQLEVMLKANGCTLKQGSGHSRFAPDEIRTAAGFYTKDEYPQAERMTTLLWHNKDGEERVAFTVMKNMPHGQITDQTRAAWNFLKQFRRPENSRKIRVKCDE